MGDLVERLWESDEASALTNQAARRIEALEAKLAAADELARMVAPSEPNASWIPDEMVWRVTFAIWPELQDDEDAKSDPRMMTREQAFLAARRGLLAAWRKARGQP